MRATRLGMIRFLTLAAVACVPAAAVRPALADAPPKPPRAARSVHLHYPAPDAVLFYNEVTVEQSQRGTYFCTCGFSHGYFGIQELVDGSKVALFSVWDPAGPGGEKQNPGEVEAARRVEVIDHGDGVRVKRFGGEGTGAQSFLDLPWEVGRPCRFVVRAAVEGDKTTYSGWVSNGPAQPAADAGRPPGAKELEGAGGWKHVATFRTSTGGAPLRGLYSFVEDFRRDGKSPDEPRSARFGNGWARTAAGDWVSLTRARFTGDDTPLDNVDAGVSEKDACFSLATGGDTRSSRPLNSLLQRTPPGVSLPAAEPPAAATRPAAGAR